MIALNETNEYAAEVAFTLPLDSDPLTGLTGYTFTLGEVQIKLPGQAWANVDLVKIVEKGYGRFCVRLTAAQCLVAGDVYVRADIDGTQYYFGSDVIGLLGGDIQESSTGSVSFFLPLETDPVNGTPLLAYDWTESGAYPSTTPRVRVCLPDGGYQDADVALIETVGFGGFKLNLSAVHTVKRGKVFVYASVPGYQRWEGYCTILGVGEAGGGSPTPPGPTPVPAPYTPADDEYVNQVAQGLNRLAEQFRSGDANYGTYNAPSVPLSEFFGPYTPNTVDDIEVDVPVSDDVTVTNHLQRALNRLPVQFRSGTLTYDLPVATIAEEVIGTFVPSTPVDSEVVLPVVDDPAVPNHVVDGLNRLPQQFRSAT